MAARDNLNPNQMKLFMTGTEWQSKVTGSVDQLRSETLSDLWSSKEAESKHPWHGGDEWDRPHGAGVYDRMAKHGYDAGPQATPHDHPEITPTRDGGLYQGEGHHRVAAAAALEREGKRTVFIPTNYRGGW